MDTYGPQGVEETVNCVDEHKSVVENGGIREFDVVDGYLFRLAGGHDEVADGGEGRDCGGEGQGEEGLGREREGGEVKEEVGERRLTESGEGGVRRGEDGEGGGGRR
ncbi:aldehyde dehydrogenase 11A3 [Striga asiatica]|uniref:Aldehyde dehydrogenase 11A3 n=1 Tax=Striga asiatica TaxID=4170 RepID=A0A5A7QMP9_STRAF|nr:aldehyde dehydrogenase 11A3 [Striga asiatica]